LNAHQARWSLFFNRFDFTLANRPGSKSQKADDRQHDASLEERDSKPIIPSSRIVAPLIWCIEATVRQAQTQEPDPGGGTH
jgi:hypothetical protein